MTTEDTTKSTEADDLEALRKVAPVQEIASEYVISLDPEGRFIWPDKDDFFDVNEVEVGGAYYERGVLYGPWVRKIRENE